MQQSETTHAVRKEATDGSFQRKWLSQDLKECYRCGGIGHHPANCRFKTQSCHHCKGVGHIARMCRKKRRDESTKAEATPSATPSKQKRKPFFAHKQGGVNVTMNPAGSDVDMEVDTGATVTVIPTKDYQSALSHVQLSPSTVRLQTYSGESLEVRGEADVPVRYGNQFAVLK